MPSYTVYRTTNKINGMFYIGVHKTTDPNDSYLGSGKRLRYAIKKYGVENFEKEILHIFETREDAFAKEKELVTEDILDSGLCYNLKIGGDGGFDFVNSRGLNNTGIRTYAKGFSPTSLTKLKMSIGVKKSYENGRRVCPPNWAGKLHRQETKDKIGRSNSIHQSGSSNSQFGTIWITDGILNKKIKKDQKIPYGWKKGRISLMGHPNV